MKDKSWVEVERISGEIQAEFIRSMLEAHGIPTILIQQGAGRAFGIGIGPLSEVLLLVPKNKLEHASNMLASYYSGDIKGFGGEDP